MEVTLLNDNICNVDGCENEWGGEVEELPIENGDFLENDDTQADQVRERLAKHLHSWEKVEATEPVLNIIKEGYKLPLYI